MALDSLLVIITQVVCRLFVRQACVLMMNGSETSLLRAALAEVA